MLAAAIPLEAQAFSENHLGIGYLEWLTNSIFVAAVVSLGIVLLARHATMQMQLVPGASQNVFEAVIEVLHDMLEGIVGKHMVGKCFSLLATLFIFILLSNWFALIPGIGSIGWGDTKGGFFNTNVEVPLLRPSTADLNMTLAMAVFFMFMWLYWTIQEVGLRGFFEHIFGVKGGLKGFLAFALIPLFFFVGIIEVVSTIFRPVSLSLRLYGNVFAGENLLTTMITLGKQFGFPEWLSAAISITVPIPFYFLELLIGILQALVFTLLCAVYLQLSTSHDEESH